jgi:homoserine dehydrogenase
MVTHDAPESAIAAALDRLEGSQSVSGKPMLMHILDV